MILLNRFPGRIIDPKGDPNGYWLMVSAEINGINPNFIMCIWLQQEIT